MKYPVGKLLKNFAHMSRAEILVYLTNQEKELREMCPDSISAGDFPIIELIEEILE